MERNSRGRIAESYDELQSVELLTRARNAVRMPSASRESFMRTILQASEIALWNLSDLLDRANSALERADWVRADAIWGWIGGFHELMLEISLLPACCLLEPGKPRENGTTQRFRMSPGRESAANRLETFCRTMLLAIDQNALPVMSVLRERSVEDPQFRLMDRVRNSSHQMTVWCDNLDRIGVATDMDYPTYVGDEHLRRAVFGFTLNEETFFLQFRGLHQIPEILGSEACDLVESAILEVRRNDCCRATRRLNAVNRVIGAVAAALKPLIANLSVLEYHKIRENLGMTSGSHSRTLSFELFTDLYAQLGSELLQHLKCPEDGGLEQERHRVHEELLRQPEFVAVIEQALEMRDRIALWRNLHIALPRNVLGSHQTKSLVGSMDALSTVCTMRNTVSQRDPLRWLGATLEMHRYPEALGAPECSQQCQSIKLLDDRILRATGELTKERFKDVQERTGYFEQQSKFRRPQRRVVKGSE